jgi:hypothetical protein
MGSRGIAGGREIKGAPAEHRGAKAMTETRTFLQGATPAIAVAIPLTAIAAVLFSDEDSDERQPCDGCGDLFAPDALGLETRLCPNCRTDAGFDCIQEDDGEL